MFKSNFDYQFVGGMCAGAYGEGGAFVEWYSRARRPWTVMYGNSGTRRSVAGDAFTEQLIGLSSGARGGVPQSMAGWPASRPMAAPRRRYLAGWSGLRRFCG
jgi:hypothetical protein